MGTFLNVLVYEILNSLAKSTDPKILHVKSLYIKHVFHL